MWKLALTKNWIPTHIVPQHLHAFRQRTRVAHHLLAHMQKYNKIVQAIHTCV